MPYISGTYSYSPNAGAYTATTALFDGTPIDTLTGVGAETNEVQTTGGSCELIVTDYASLTALVDFGGLYALDTMYYAAALAGYATHGSIGVCGIVTGWASFPVLAYESQNATAQYSTDGVSWVSLTAGTPPASTGTFPADWVVTAAISPAVTARYARLHAGVRGGTWIVVGTLSAALSFTDFRFTGEPVTGGTGCTPPTAFSLTASQSCCGSSHSLTWGESQNAASYSLYHASPSDAPLSPVATGLTALTYSYPVPPSERPYGHLWAVYAANGCGSETATASIAPVYAAGDCSGGDWEAGEADCSAWSAPSCTG